MLKRSLINLLLLTTAVTSSAAIAWSSADCTPITATPFTIMQPGDYCLTQDISNSVIGGAAISIKASDVRLNLGYHSLSNSMGRTGNAATGIFASGRSNIQIFNGNVIGWGTGIKIQGPKSKGNTISGIKFKYIRKTAIDAEGIGLLVKRNWFTDIGGSSRFDNATGIEFSGISPVIKYNHFRNIMASGGNGNGTGVNLHETTNPTLEDNTFDFIRGLKLGFGCGLTLKATFNALLDNNHFQSSDIGVSSESDSTGLIRDMLTSDVGTPVSGLGMIFVEHSF